jgi:hypothetical protein
MHFGTKNYLKSTRNYTAKHAKNLVRDFHCHPLLIISERNKKIYKVHFFSCACHVEH